MLYRKMMIVRCDMVSKYYKPVDVDKRKKEVIRDHTLRIRMTAEEQERYNRIAKEHNVTMAGVFRRAMEELDKKE